MRWNLTDAVLGSGDNYGDAIKDITDNWTFDFIEHFPPLAGLTIDQLLQFRTYAIAQLIGRILGTDEQVTYMNGDLPVSCYDHSRRSSTSTRAAKAAATLIQPTSIERSSRCALLPTTVTER